MHRSRPIFRMAVLLALGATQCGDNAAGELFTASLAVENGSVIVEVVSAQPGADLCATMAVDGGPPMDIGCAQVDEDGLAGVRTRLDPSIQEGQILDLRGEVVEQGYQSDPMLRRVTKPGNLLILMADDVGVDRIAMYDVARPIGTAARTPALDALAAQGVRFDSAYSMPNCSPTRAALLTGRNPWRTGVGTALHDKGVAFLRPEEVTLPEMLRTRRPEYTSHAIGKWHLGSDKLEGDDATAHGLSPDGTTNFEHNPTEVHGFDTFVGTYIGPETAAGASSYRDWVQSRTTRGDPVVTRVEIPQWATVEHTYEVLDRLGQLSANPDDPWLMYVAYNAPHSPYGYPPNAAWAGGDSCVCDDAAICPSADCTVHGHEYNAMVEAVDRSVGEILAELDANPTMAARTTVLFLGDNGTPDSPARDVGAQDVVKGTIFQGGIHIPFLVRGPWAGAGRTTSAPTSVVDVFATLAELAGEPYMKRELKALGVDSQSLIPTLLDPNRLVDRTLVSEIFETPGLPPVRSNPTFHRRALIRGGYKLHVEHDFTRAEPRHEVLYALSGPLEGDPVCQGGPDDMLANCLAASDDTAHAYAALDRDESALRAEVDPLHGHCGDEGLDCPVVLPIRVMPQTVAGFTDGSHTAERWFALTADEVHALGSCAGTLYVQGHRLGYRDGFMADDGSGPRKDGKASVRLGSCDWIPLQNDHPDIDVQEPERFYDGIGGGFRTVRLDLTPANLTSCLEAGMNRIEFRFEETDGVSSGYRILDFNLKIGELAILGPEHFVHEDPDAWRAPSTQHSDTSAGAALFQARRRLLDSPLTDHQTNAACGDCHAWDGRDLEYFAYSTESIVNRSIFHGLTEQEGLQIASWIRTRMDVPRRGRPWNPPYQPGPGLDADPEGWAAGAGLEAVVPEAIAGRQMLDGLFPNGWSSTEAIARQLRGEGLDAGTSNLREVPIAIQLPDWNAWLPEKHPFDLWGKPYYDYSQDPTAELCTASTIPPLPDRATPEEVYLAIRSDLAAGAWTPDQLPGIVGRLDPVVTAWVNCESTLRMSGGEWRHHRSPTLDRARDRGFEIGFTKRNLAQWMAVKNWELAHETLYSDTPYEQLGPQVHGPDRGEALSWPIGDHQSVHPVAPHIASINRNNLEESRRAELAWQLANWDSAPTAQEHGTLYCDSAPSRCGTPFCICDAAEKAACTPGAGDHGLPSTSPQDVAQCFDACTYPEFHANQTRLKGDYDSTAWYHLQIVLNAGAKGHGASDAVSPVDWPYSYEHIYDLGAAARDEGGGASGGSPP